MITLQSLARLPVTAWRRLQQKPAARPTDIKPKPAQTGSPIGGPADVERRQLAAIAPIPCDMSRLACLGPDALEGLFAAPWLESGWVEDDVAALALPEMTGGVNPGDQRAIHYLIQALQPRSILEIGTHIGCSTVNIALALRRLKNGPNSITGRLLTVDIRDVNDQAAMPWLEYGSRSSPQELCEHSGCGDLVDFHQADSLEFLENCADTFDFVFLDGLHDAAQVYQEIPLALARLNPDGVVLLHDYFPGLKPLWSNGAMIPGPCLAVERLLSEGAELAVHPLGALPWPTKLNSNVTSLALLVGGGRE
jgi:predicted O-methyltransferase YrrM